MEIEYINRTLIQYKTASGFQIQALKSGQALPFYNADSNSIVWYEPVVSFRAEPAAHADFWAAPNIYSAEFFDYWRNETNCQATLTQCTTAQYSSLVAPYSDTSIAVDTLECSSAFYVVSVAESEVGKSARSLNNSERKIAGHKPCHFALMAGKKYLVSHSEQERSELSARDHVTHLEPIALSREHSNQPECTHTGTHSQLLGWRTWTRHLPYSNSLSTASSRYTRGATHCRLSGTISGPMN